MQHATSMLMIAVAKGRILDEALPLLKRAGIEPDEDLATSRKLVVGTSREGIGMVIIRAHDVPTYVGYGAADLGITGKDVLLEYDGDNLYEPLDLRIARCRLMVACRQDHTVQHDRPRVATKYPNVARRYYAGKGMQAEVIKLYGSMELAPILGLADKIVDLVDTGQTLKANGLVAEATICAVSSRVVVNKASMKIHNARIKALLQALAEARDG